MIYCLKGATLLYNGQEKSAVFRPSLFDRDTIDWENGEDCSALLRRLHDIKQNPLFAESAFRVLDSGNGVLQTVYSKGQVRMIGLFSLRGASALVETPCPDGRYTNQIDGSAVYVEGGLTFTNGEPVLFCTDRI